MFGVLAQSFNMRQTQMLVQAYEEVGNTAGVVQELVKFLRLLIFFDNIYHAPEE